MAEREQPLWHRIYFKEPYTELCRTVGYAGLSMPEAQAKMKPLTERFGKELMAQIAEEIVRIDPSTSPPTARLKDETRRYCHQLLGPDPNIQHMGDARQTAMEMGERLKAESKDTRQVKPNKKPRPKKAPKPAPVNGTPLMEQYRAAKERHPNMLLLFRVGDFYEAFSDDAKSLATLLGLTLTSRDKTTEMAGFPAHSLETYLQRLLKAGIRVAIADQVDSADGKRVERVVTRTPADGPYAEGD